MAAAASLLSRLIVFAADSTHRSIRVPRAYAVSDDGPVPSGFCQKEFYRGPAPALAQM